MSVFSAVEPDAGIEQKQLTAAFRSLQVERRCLCAFQACPDHQWRLHGVQAAQKPADAETRTQFLTREQIVKVLEYLHQDDE